MKKFNKHIYHCDCDKYSIYDELLYKMEQLYDDLRLFMYVGLFTSYLILAIAAL